MNIKEITASIEIAVNEIFKKGKAKEVLAKLEEKAKDSSNAFWWQKLIALANIIIVELEDDDRELSGASKKIIAEEVLSPIWDSYVPAKIKTLNALSFGYLKKTALNLVIDGLVLAFNATFGKAWLKVSEQAKEAQEAQKRG